MGGHQLTEHIAVDPDVCNGAPRIAGTRIPVRDVLEGVAAQLDWDTIVEESKGAVSGPAIAEAVWLAAQVFAKQARVPPKEELDAPPTVYGEYVVADPAICHGRPTFRGTRIFVCSVLRQVAEGMDWDEITAEWRGSVPGPAIAEAVRVANRVFHEHVDDLDLQPTPA